MRKLIIIVVSLTLLLSLFSVFIFADTTVVSSNSSDLDKPLLYHNVQYTINGEIGQASDLGLSLRDCQLEFGKAYLNNNYQCGVFNSYTIDGLDGYSDYHINDYGFVGALTGNNAYSGTQRKSLTGRFILNSIQQNNFVVTSDVQTSTYTRYFTDWNYTGVYANYEVTFLNYEYTDGTRTHNTETIRISLPLSKDTFSGTDSMFNGETYYHIAFMPSKLYDLIPDTAFINGMCYISSYNCYFTANFNGNSTTGLASDSGIIVAGSRYYGSDLPSMLLDNYIDRAVPVYDTSIEEVSFTRWLASATDGILSFELIPGLSFMNILWFIIGISLVIIILKVFAGG